MPVAAGQQHEIPPVKERMPWVGSKDRTFDRLAMVDADPDEGRLQLSDNSFMPERKVYTPSEQCIFAHMSSFTVSI